MGFTPVYGLQMPAVPPITFLPTFTTGLLIDATGEKIAFMGRVWNKDRATKSISRVGFMFGAVTKAGGSGLTISLQDVSVAAGPPGRPDETPDQTVAVANADATFATNTWHRSGALSANRSVAYGELLAVVIEYDGTGRLGADSVIVNSLSPAGNPELDMLAGSALKTGGTWATGTGIGNLILEFDDGTFGTFVGAFPTNGITATAYNTGSAADEIALEFTVPGPVKVDGAWVATLMAANANVDVVLYEDTTTLVTVSTDLRTIIQAAAPRRLRLPFAEQLLTPGHTYRLSLKPTTGNSVTAYDLGVASADHLQAWPLGTAAYYTSRADAGTWTPNTAKRPMMGLYVSAISDGGFPASRVRLGM